MSDVQATYGIQLAVDGADSAEDAAKSLENLRDAIGEDNAALREMQATLRRLQGSTTTTAETFKELRDAISAKKLQLAQGSQALVKMKGAYDGLGPAAKRALEAQRAEATAAKLAAKEKEKEAKQAAKTLADSTKTQHDAVSKLAGEMGAAEPSFRGLKLSTLAQVPPALAAAAAFIVVAGAVAFAAAAFVKFGLAAGDARRNEALMIQAAGTHLWYAYGLEASKAADLTSQGALAIQGAIDRVSASTSIGRDQIAGFATQLMAARLGGQNLEKALKAVSTAAAVGKDAGLVGAFASIQFMGGSVDKLADKIEQKFGGIVKRQMLSLDVQSKKLHENLDKLWKGINVEPLLEAINKVLRLFSTSTASGYALQHLLQALFPTDSVKGFGDAGAKAFKILVIGAQYLVLSVLTVRNKVEDLDTWINKTFFNGEQKVNSFRTALEGLGNTILRIIPGGELAKDLFAGFDASTEGTGKVEAAMEDLKAAQKAGLDALNASDGTAQGRAVTAGIAKGIEEGKPGVLESMGTLGKAMLKSFATSIDAHSPSKLFQKYARWAPEGVVLGVRAGIPDVERAVDDMVSAPERPAASAASAGGGGGRAITVQVDVGGITIGDSGGKDSKAMGASLQTEVEAMFERAAQQLTAALGTT